MNLGFDKRLEIALRSLVRRLWTGIGDVPPSELLYQTLFDANSSRLGLQLPPLYPVRGGANFSLLYVLMRAVTELPIHRVLELGGGQSSLLLDAISKNRAKPLEILTIETDADWVERLQPRVAHEVRHVPLNADGQYASKIDGHFELVLVDGPWGERRNSRSSCLPLLDSNLSPEFLVVFDDAQRRGERDTIERFMRRCGRLSGATFVHGSSSQALLCSAAMTASQYF